MCLMLRHRLKGFGDFSILSTFSKLFIDRVLDSNPILLSVKAIGSGEKVEGAEYLRDLLMSPDKQSIEKDWCKEIMINAF